MLHSSVTRMKDPINYLRRSYKKISEILNTNKSKMRHFRIRPSVKSAIASFCEKNGLFCSWNELLSVKGMTILPLQKACQSTAGSKHVKRAQAKKSLHTRVYPSLNSTVIKSDTKILGIHIRQNLLCWAVVKGDSTVQDLNCKSLEQPLPLANVYEVVKMTSMIPDILEASDIYVMEESRPLLTGNKKLNQMKNQTDIMYAVLIGCFLLQKKTIAVPKDDNNVYIMRNGTTAKHFNLQLGSEVVTTNYLMDPMLAKLKVPTHWKHQYLRKSKWEREELGWALLNTLAFIEICNSLSGSKNLNKNKNN